MGTGKWYPHCLVKLRSGLGADHHFVPDLYTMWKSVRSLKRRLFSQTIGISPWWDMLWGRYNSITTNKVRDGTEAWTNCSGMVLQRWIGYPEYISVQVLFFGVMFSRDSEWVRCCTEKCFGYWPPTHHWSILADKARFYFSWFARFVAKQYGNSVLIKKHFRRHWIQIQSEFRRVAK